jgi:hypothetical protein
MVSVFALAYFLLAELVYKNNALYVYTSKTETGGKMWNDAIRGLMLGLVFAHILLACYLLMHGALGQVTVVLFLVGADFLFINYCHQTYELPSEKVPLEIAKQKDEKDRQSGAVSRCKFSNQMYEQPALRLASVTEEQFQDPNTTPGFLDDMTDEAEVYYSTYGMKGKPKHKASDIGNGGADSGIC